MVTGDRIRERRHELGLSLGDVAELAGFTGRNPASVIQKIENGVTRSPQYKTLAAICRVLQIDLVDGNPLDALDSPSSTTHNREGHRMYRGPDTNGEWRPYHLFETPEQYQIGDKLEIRERGKRYEAVVRGLDGRHVVVPVESSG